MALLAAAALAAPSSGAPIDEEELARFIGNFSQVSPGVYRGARPSPAAMRILAVRGMRGDLSFQGGPVGNRALDWLIGAVDENEKLESVAKEGEIARGLGLAFFSAPLNSFFGVDENETRLIEAALVFMHDPAHQPVFVHCAHGNDRTGLVVALYRVRYEGWKPLAAHDEMVAKGHNGVDGLLWTSAMDRAFWALSEKYVRERAG